MTSQIGSADPNRHALTRSFQTSAHSTQRPSCRLFSRALIVVVQTTSRRPMQISCFLATINPCYESFLKVTQQEYGRPESAPPGRTKGRHVVTAQRLTIVCNARRWP